jgi:hypothetical protein
MTFPSERTWRDSPDLFEVSRPEESKIPVIKRMRGRTPSRHTGVSKDAEYLFVYRHALEQSLNHEPTSQLALKAYLIETCSKTKRRDLIPTMLDQSSPLLC